MIETSICIEKGRKAKLLHAVELTGIGVSILIAQLVEKARLMFTDSPVLFRTVRYQQCGEDRDIMHISIDRVTYEYATSQRYIFKISVSFLIRCAIDFFLDDIIEGNQSKCDNDSKCYVSTNSRSADFCWDSFSVNHLFSNGYEHWKINWQRQKEKTPRQTEMKRRT